MRCLVVLLALTLPAQAQNSPLREFATREDLRGWEAVGRLDHPFGFCTAVLIAPDLVLTAAHCTFHARTGAPLDPGELTFRAGLIAGTAIAERRGRRYVAHPGYQHDEGYLTAEDLSHDVALVELESPVPTSEIPPFLVSMAGVPGTEVSVVSYGEGRSDALSRQRLCTITVRVSEIVGFDCDVTYGSSGAPVFENSGRRARIVSLISAIDVGSGQARAFGMELPDRVAELKSALRSGRGVVEAATTGEAPPITFVAPGNGPAASGGAKFVPARP